MLENNAQPSGIEMTTTLLITATERTLAPAWGNTDPGKIAGSQL